MDTLINLAPKFLGLGWAWEKLDGYKTAIAAFAVMLHTGAAFVLMLAGLVDQAGPLLAAHNLAGVVHLAQGLKHFGENPAVADFSTTWAKFYATLGLIGVGHKLEKSGGDAPEKPADPVKAVQDGAASATKPAA